MYQVKDIQGMIITAMEQANKFYDEEDEVALEAVKGTTTN